MLTRFTTGWVLLISLAATSVEAQFRPRAPGCQRCGSAVHAPPAMPPLPPPTVGYAPVGFAPVGGINPACGCRTPIVQQQMRPVVEMRFQPQQVVTYQDVVKTQIRREQQVVSVPVTTTRQVTVDEGSYKTVWVPNMVTRQVTETAMQQQVQQRDVPYQVVERIPQVQTQLIPQQTVRYVPGYQTVYGYGAPAPVTAAVPMPIAAVPSATTTQAPIAQATPTPVAASPAPAPQAASTNDWKSIPQRQAQSDNAIQQQSFERQGLQEPRRAFSPGVPTAVRAFPGYVR